MKLILITLITPLMLMLNTDTKTLFDYTIKNIDGKPLNLMAYKGKYILLVNTASECGYTTQYKALQTLSEQQKAKLVVIALPSNDFGGQEPGNASEIKTFCQKNYGVAFPITEKIHTKGENQHPIYQFLTQKKLNGLNDFSVRWNFNKFLIDPKGQLIAYFPSSVAPDSDKILAYLK